MEIEHKKITPKIHLLIFQNQLSLTSTFLRFQEYYESPYFNGKIFSLEEFKLWYIKNSPNGIKTGEFTYYTDWNGFNIPSYILQPFYEGEFKNLSESEKLILDFFKNEKSSFYVIGVHSEGEKTELVLKHEIAHALFYTNESYKKEVLATMGEYDTTILREKIRQLGSYSEGVLDDEVHAYSINPSEKFDQYIPRTLSESLNKIYDKYLGK